MAKESLYLPNINKVMTKQEQANALLEEALSMLEKPKNCQEHSIKQIEGQSSELARYFPDLTQQLKKECQMMTEANLQLKKKQTSSAIKKAGMVILEFADACRDLGNEKEYEAAVLAYKKVSSVLLN